MQEIGLGNVYAHNSIIVGIFKNAIITEYFFHGIYI